MLHEVWHGGSWSTETWYDGGLMMPTVLWYCGSQMPTVPLALGRYKVTDRFGVMGKKVKEAIESGN